MITPAILIEDLVSRHPQSVRYLLQQGIRCIACGDPIWGTLEGAARDRGFTDKEIERFVDELNLLMQPKDK